MEAPEFGFYQVMATITNPTVNFGEIYVFPNPVPPGKKMTLHVDTGKVEDISYRIYDVSGDLVKEGHIDTQITVVNGKPCYEYQLTLPNVGGGTYYGVVTGGRSGKEVRKQFKFSVLK